MTTTKIVSFFATPPGTDFTTDDYTQPVVLKTALVVETTFLIAAWKSFKEKKAVPTGLLAAPVSAAKLPEHMIVRVSSVEAIAQWVSTYNRLVHDPSNLRIQIVGHGYYGHIALGWFWDQSTPLYSPPYPSFDSNPNAIGQLSFYKAFIDEIMLAGCYVANPYYSLDVTDGRTLLFALSEMLGCRARGAVISVDPTQFDDHAWYVGKKGARPIGWRGTPKGAEPDGALELAWITRPSRLEPPRRLASRSHAILDRDQIGAFCAYYNARLQDPELEPRLALPELELSLDYGDHQRRAALTCGGRFLLVDDHAGRTFYTTDLHETPNVVRAVVALLRGASFRDGRRSGTGAS